MSHSPVVPFVLQLLLSLEITDIQQQAFFTLVDLLENYITKLAHEVSSLALSSRRTQVSLVDIYALFRSKNILLQPKKYQPMILERASGPQSRRKIEIPSDTKQKLEPHAPDYPSCHTFLASELVWRPDASSSQVLQKRNVQIRQVEENLKRLLLPSLGKFEKKMMKALPKQSMAQLVPHRDLTVLNYESFRFGVDGLISKRKREAEVSVQQEEYQDPDIDLVDL
jgi:hypothetical protein